MFNLFSAGFARLQSAQGPSGIADQSASLREVFSSLPDRQPKRREPEGLPPDVAYHSHGHARLMRDGKRIKQVIDARANDIPKLAATSGAWNDAFGLRQGDRIAHEAEPPMRHAKQWTVPGLMRKGWKEVGGAGHHHRGRAGF